MGSRGIFLAVALAAGCAKKDAAPSGPACPALLLACSGGCADGRVDPQNCGACGKACGAGEVCSAGVCALSCAGGSTQCGASCVALASDPKHCGACGNACDPGKVCSQSKCDLACLGGTTRCGEHCVELDDDPAFCGDCMTTCKAGEICAAGTCSKPCAPAETLCPGAGCVDTNTSFGSCGGCGKACKAGEICAKGACIAGQLYALGSKAGSLYTVDPAAAKLVPVAKLVTPVVGAVFKDGQLYGVGDAGGTVYRINVVTGTAEAIAATGGPGQGLALRADGLLTACNDSEFVTIDPATGVAVPSGVTQCQAPSAFGADAGGAMYLVRQSVLYHIDDKYNLSLINVCDAKGDVLKGLTFHKGVLYALDVSVAQPLLVTIDPATAKVKVIGPLAPDIQALASPVP